MNPDNKGIIAFVLTIVILTSMINFAHINYSYGGSGKHNIDDYSEFYYYQDALSILEEKTKNEINNLQSYRSSNKMVSSCLNKYFVDSIYVSNNSSKMVYTAEIKSIIDIYFDSVFVVSYIHKKDGKI